MNKNKPLFSIMIPVYNIKNYVDECLKSVLAQTFDDYEVVVIDDGATDGSGEICDRYSEENDKIRVIHKKNGGLLAARRTGIAEAKGKIGIFLDGDDYLEPDCLSSLNEIFSKNPGSDMVIYNFLYSYEKDGSKKPKEPLFSEGRSFTGDEKRELYDQLISTYNLNNIWIKAVDMDLLKRDDTDYEPFYSNSFGEDLLQSLYLVTEAKKIIYTGKTLYNYRINAGSMTAMVNFAALDKQNHMKVFYVLKEYMKKWNMDNRLYMDKLYGRRYTHLAISFWKYFPKMTDSAEKTKLVKTFNGYFDKMKENSYIRNRNISFIRKVTIFLVKNKLMSGIELLAHMKR